VLLLAIFPRNAKPDAQREKNNQANKLIAKLADNKKVFFLDINQNFLNPDQTLSKEIMPDFLHPNRVGYQIWAISMKDKLNELMK
jgi:beta-glucosidase